MWTFIANEEHELACSCFRHNFLNWYPCTLQTFNILGSEVGRGGREGG